MPAQGADQKCPLGALDRAKGPVEIRFWHFTNSANTDALERLTAQFNSSQSAVHVSLIVQPTYDDVITKYIAGLTTGDLPDVAMIEDARLQQMIDTQSILPVDACIKADSYDMGDQLERATSYYTVQDTLWPMPFNVSTPVLYYDKKAFEAAGLDPDAPPTTLDEITEAAQQLKDSGASTEAGFVLKLEPGTFEQFTAKAGKLYVNNGNGRTSRTTETVFDTRIGREVFTWMSEMVSSGLAITNTSEGPAAFDNLIAIGNGDAAMTIDTSAALGTITQILDSGQYPNVELGVAPMAGPSSPRGGVSVDGAALYISNKSGKAEQAASWEFLKFLNSPEIQADWAASTGYVPLRKSATELPVIQRVVGRQPGLQGAVRPARHRAEQHRDRRSGDRRLQGRARRDPRRRGVDVHTRHQAASGVEAGQGERRRRDRGVQLARRRVDRRRRERSPSIHHRAKERR